MGFVDYPAYLRSDLWKSIRDDCLERSNYTCHVCGGRANTVHHKWYSRQVLQGKDFKGLMAVCKFCHEAGEFKGKRKTSPDEATERMERQARRCAG